MFSFRFTFAILRGVCLVKFAGSAGNPEFFGEFAAWKSSIRGERKKGKKKKREIKYLGLYDRNVFFICLLYGSINSNDQLKEL